MPAACGPVFAGAVAIERGAAIYRAQQARHPVADDSSGREHERNPRLATDRSTVRRRLGQARATTPGMVARQRRAGRRGARSRTAAGRRGRQHRLPGTVPGGSGIGRSAGTGGGPRRRRMAGVAPARPRRDGRGARSRTRRRPVRTARRIEAHRACGWRRLGALPQRTAHPGPAGPSRHRAHDRRRPARRRPALHGHGIRGGHADRPLVRAAACHRARTRGAGGAGLRSGGACACAAGRAPRHQAVQPDGGWRRPRAADRFRRGRSGRRRQRRQRARAVVAGLCRAGTAGRRRSGRGRRHPRHGRRAVPPAVRTSTAWPGRSARRPAGDARHARRSAAAARQRRDGRRAA